ncbi:chemotaxis protein [Pasteurellaceae bacterium 22721_9_1]
MPLPFILAGAAVAAAGFGAKKGYDGYQIKSAAEAISKRATDKYEIHKNLFEEQSELTTKSLDKLGELQLQIGVDFKSFQEIAEELLNQVEKSQNKDLEINLPQHQLDKIADLSLSATEYLGQLATGAVAGTAAAYAVYGGVMAFAAASTGTPITALAGVAAHNAAMAAIGGGSIAAGGFGMAGGAMVLGAAVAAPIIAVAGWAYNSHAEKAKANAEKYASEVKDAIYKMCLSTKHLCETESYVSSLHKELERIYTVFKQYFEELKSINTLLKSGSINLDVVSDSLLLSIDNGYQVAAILTDIITTPLFKVKTDFSGNAIINKDGIPEMELDKDNMKIINEDELKAVLHKGSYEELKKLARS